jgi:hypothetical protein
MSKIVTLKMSVRSADIFLAKVQAVAKSISKTDVRRLKKIRSLFEEKTKAYNDAQAEAKDVYDERCEDVWLKYMNTDGKPMPDDIGMLNMEMGVLNRQYSKQVEKIVEELGDRQAEFVMSDEDYSYVKDRWDKAGEFTGNVAMQDAVEDVEQAFEDRDETSLEELKKQAEAKPREEEAE